MCVRVCVVGERCRYEPGHRVQPNPSCLSYITNPVINDRHPHHAGKNHIQEKMWTLKCIKDDGEREKGKKSN